ncbi:MAG: META domain-containing protein, partial [Caldilineaceae bacterium]
DTDWTLVAMDEAMGVAYDPAQGAVTMHFNEDGSVSGNAGCNNFNGGFTDDGATITFTPLATTRMLCPEAQMGVENAMLAVLDGSVQYSIEGSTLTMTSTSGTLVFEGVPAVAEDAAAADEALPPFGTLWTLVSFDENMGVEFDPAVTTVTATFTEDGQVSGTSGCNNYFGGFTVDGTLVTFEPLGGTRMMCEEPANSVEFAFLNAMQGEALYQINGSTLELITGEGTLTFTGTPAAAESAPADAAFTGTTWTLVAFDEIMAVEFDPAVVAVEITFMDDGSLSGNGGCNNFSGGYSVEGSFITFGAIATTMMACPDPASTVEAAVFGALQGEAQYQISGNTMELITGVGTLTFEAQ